MKKPTLIYSIGRLALIILPVLILYTLLFYSGYLPVLSDSISFDAKAYELKRVNLKHTEVIVVGSSVALNDLNTKIIKENIPLSYYNFGAWSLQVDDDYKMLKHYVAKYKPRYVLFPSTMHDFSSDPDPSLPYDIDLGDQALGYYYIKNFANLNEIIKRKSALALSRKDNNRYDCLLFDDGGGVELQLTKDNISQKRLKMDIGEFPTKNTPDAYKSLTEMASFLKNNRVKLIFIQTPYNSYFVKTPQLKENVNAHFEKCRTIVENSGGAYLNYHDFFASADSGMFVDPSHLSGQGSKVLTRKIVKDLQGIIY